MDGYADDLTAVIEALDLKDESRSTIRQADINDPLE
jgi:hypothetical protein